jgi:hypothetical protein
VTTPLADEQIVDLRRDVDAGKRRRVVLLTDSAGLPAGKAGEVTRVGLPEVDGSDFIGVRIGGDELFFSPVEIGLGTGRKAAAPQKAPKAPAQRTPRTQAPADAASRTEPAGAAVVAQSTPAPSGAPARSQSAPPATSQSTGAAKSPAAAAPAKSTASAPAAKKAPAKAPAKTPDKLPAKAPVKASAGTAAKPATKAATRTSRKPVRTPAIAITVRSTDAGWTVEAHRGGKVALKATPVRAGTVQEIADALDEDPITGIVREVLDARRAVAESEAGELREALARAEAVLAEYEAGH